MHPSVYCKTTYKGFNMYYDRIAQEGSVRKSNPTVVCVFGTRDLSYQHVY